MKCPGPQQWNYKTLLGVIRLEQMNRHNKHILELKSKYYKDFKPP